MKRKSHEEFVKEIMLSNRPIEVLGKYVNCSTKIEVRCLKCYNTWSATPNSLLRGSGCPTCSNNQKKTQDKFIQQLESCNPYIKTLGVYTNSHTPLKVKCTICGNEWMCKPMNLLRGAQCPNCTKPHTSFMEQFILLAFQNAIGQTMVESRNKTAIGLELDIYIPSYNLAIEPGTWLYHKNKVHNTDFNKREKCKKNNIRLITIYDTYPANEEPPYETDCYVFNGFLNEYGHNRLINLIKHLMTDFGIEYANLNWDQIANDAYANCHYNATMDFINKLKIISPNIEVLESFKGSKIPISVNNTTCDHPAWKARPETLLKGIGCPECGKIKASKSKTRTHLEFEKEIKRINPTIKLNGQYSKITERIDVICKECGHVWSPLAYSLISGKGCPHCSAKKGAQKRKNKLSTKTTEQFKNEISAINKNIIIKGDYINNKTKIEVECLICGYQWRVVPATLLNGHGCPNCAHKNKTSKKIPINIK